MATVHELKDVEVVLLDIEGTVCPISFVKDVLFPYALTVLPSVLQTEWSSPALAPYISAFPPPHNISPAALLAHVQDLMARDLKIPYLKALQGYLWLRGYQSGVLKCPLFPDVAPSLRAWKTQGRKIVIYSSGSVPAQKLLFQYTTEIEGDGDLRGLVSGWYDTVNAGMKSDAGSYRKIAGTVGVREGRVLFLSDNLSEVEAARGAGMRSYVVVREGNAPLSGEEGEGQVCVKSFGEVKLV
ncbi:HAD-like domain-containing protein [Amylocarpus encephaloides]|uniref:Enolase-phosphatase E1 n=1 Tax=Amylocarpus encephaloides TaxID=45428 RepID=A0A9P7YMW8_9HELO|nr:HAD-like domain-containing protein [Amylocarpus encephaloides]